MIQTIGKYRVLERIGHGAMGTVLKAHDPVLDRVVALKLISSHLEVTSELRTRFFREAQTCARLAHRNIVTIHDLAEIDGQLVIVMEFLDGEELKELIAQQRALSLEEKLDLMIQVCDGLAYAHREGVIHRDIKPANILVLKNGGVKILDFGIARIVNADSGLTRTGFIVGTLRYMAPEQSRGQVDHRTDIFAVGAVFYEFLVNRPAFPGDSPIEILEALRSYEPPPLNEVDPAIPVELAETIASALRKDPGTRLADLAQMRERLLETQQNLTAEGKLVRERLRARVAEARRLHEMVAERLGRPLEPEPTVVITDAVRVADLMANEQAVVLRIERLRAALERATALEPTVTRGLERLQAGSFVEAIADLESVVSALPEHGRAAAALDQARAAHALETRRRDQLARLDVARRAHAHGAFAECRASLEGLHDALPEIAAPVEALSLAVDAAGARERAVEARRLHGEPASDASPAWPDAEATAARAGEALRDGRHGAASEAYRAAIDLYDRAERDAASRAFDTIALETDATAPVSSAAGVDLDVTRSDDDTTLIVLPPPSAPPESPPTRRIAATRPFEETAIGRRRDPVRWATTPLLAAVGAVAVVMAGGYLVWSIVAPSKTAVSTPPAPRQIPSPDVAAERQAVEELRRRVADARKESDAAQAGARAAAAFGSAVERQRAAEVAAAAQRWAEARTGYAAALADYEAATAEARRAGRAEDARAQAAEDARAASRAARTAAERSGAGPSTSPAFQSASRLERDGQSALTQRDYDTAQKRFRESEGQYRAATAEARATAEAERGRRAAEVEQLRQRSSASGQEAEQAGGDRYAAGHMSTARAKARDALAALGRQDYSRAALLFREAESEFKVATQDAQRQANVERQAAVRERQAAEVEKLRKDVGALRDQATKAEAGTLARDLFQAAQAREREGEGLYTARDYAAAAQKYQEAAGQYDGAVKRAAALGEARTRANQDRARMEADKQRAQPGSPGFSDAQRQEQEGATLYQSFAFKEAGERFRSAALLYAKAVPPSPPPPAPRDPSAPRERDLAPFSPDPSSDLKKVIADLKRAYESKDVALLQQIRPGLTPEELRRIRETFDNLRTYQLDLQVEAIHVQGNDAQARAFRKDLTVAKDGQIYRTESRVTVRFKRQRDRWTIDDIK
jgi:hypothetical protein